KPVNRSVSLTAAFLSLLGCALGGVSSALNVAPLIVLKGGQYLSAFTLEQKQSLALTFLKFSVQTSNLGLGFFGCYCALIGYLILKSTFLPRIVGMGMVIAGLSWLTFLWPPLASSLAPYNMIPGMLGEAALTLWLIVMGVNSEQWKAQESLVQV